MKLKYQSTNKDCFKTCFENALTYFGQPIPETVKKHIEIYKDGLETTTPLGGQVFPEKYIRSFNQMKEDWYLSSSAINDPLFDTQLLEYTPKCWVKSLIESGVTLDFRWNSIGFKEYFIDFLKSGSILICDVIPHLDVPIEQRPGHAVLVLKTEQDKVYIHDPLAKHQNFQLEYSQPIKNQIANRWVDLDMFFSDNQNSFIPNHKNGSTQTNAWVLVITQNSIE